MWILDQNKDGFYILSSYANGSLINLTLDDLELLADMFRDKVTEADEWDPYEDEDLIEE